jgi:serine protease Do
MTHEKQIIEAVKKTLPAVISIAVSKDLELIEKTLPFQEYGIMPQLENLPTDEQGRVKLGGGSGFIVSSDGVVLTNKHVIMDPQASYAVVDGEGKHYAVRILARDPVQDVAILKIDIPAGEAINGKKWPTVALGDSHRLALGQTVIAIGNALGEFQSTVSTGIVSGLSRFITAVTDMQGNTARLRGLIQTDAAINPGNSGGPLLNLAGEVIGINAAVVFGAQNIGFAIPIEKAKRDLADIATRGHICRPFLGIRYVLLNPAFAKRYNLPMDHGALLMRENIPGDHAVVPGSAAEKAGLREHDIILTCNNEPLTEQKTIEDMLENASPGDEITLSIFRNGKENEAKITLEEWK